MVVKILKKIGMAFIYYIIAVTFSTLFDMFGFYVARGPVWALLQIIALGAIILACSKTLRTAKLKKEHKGDESEEKRIFNSDLKTKIKFIIKTNDFIIECVLFLIASIIIFVHPGLGAVVLYFFPVRIYFVMLFILSVFMALYMAVLDIAAWIMAYNRCYKRREY